MVSGLASSCDLIRPSWQAHLSHDDYPEDQVAKAVDFRGLGKSYGKKKLNYFYNLILKIVSCVLRFFKVHSEKIERKLEDHNYQASMHSLCRKFVRKLDIGDTQQAEPEKGLTIQVFLAEQVNLQSAKFVYQSSKYLKYLRQVQALQDMLQSGKIANFDEDFNRLPPRLQRALCEVISLSQNLKNSEEGKKQLLLNPKILEEIKNDQGENVLQQFAFVFGQIEACYRDLSLLTIAKQQVDDPEKCSKALGAISSRSSLIMNLEAIKSANHEEKIPLIENGINALMKQQIQPMKKALKPLQIEARDVFDTSINRLGEDLTDDVMSEPITVAMVAVEHSALISQGGLAEAVEGMANSLAQMNPENRVRLIFPKYSTLPKEIMGQLQKCREIYVDSKGVPIEVYRVTLDSGVECYFIEHPSFELKGEKPNIYDEQAKERFTAFSGMAADLLYQMKGNDVIHLHDWHAAGVAMKLSKEHREEWEKGEIPPVVFTFHNNSRASQGRHAMGPYNYDPVFCALKESGLAGRNDNIFLETLQLVDMVTTVSENFGIEAQTPKLGEGIAFAVKKAAKLGKLIGIVNGSNPERWDPETDKGLLGWRDIDTGYPCPLDYSPEREDILEQKQESKVQLVKWIAKHGPAKALKFDPEKPIVTYVGRLDAYQKGLDKLDEAIASTLKNGGQFVVMGSQEIGAASEILDMLEKKYPEGVLFIRDFKTQKGMYHYQQGDAEAGRPGIGSVVRAASDFIMIPSSFEPCGIVQFEGWLFGSQAIGSRTGGLTNTIRTRKEGFINPNGYLFDRDSVETGVGQVVAEAIHEWKTKTPDEKAQITRRLIADGRKCGWDSTPEGMSPIQKYRFVYQSAIQRVTKRKACPQLGRFNLSEFLHRHTAPKNLEELDPAYEGEEEYLEAYYSGAFDSEQLEVLYYRLNKALRSQVPPPHGKGVDYRRHDVYGAKLSEKGVVFCVDAPNAKSAAVRLYDDNGKKIREVPLKKDLQGSWAVEIDGVGAGQRYRYVINKKRKIDPYGLQHVPSHKDKSPPFSVVCDRSSFNWEDDAWIKARSKDAGEAKPVSIYELHPASWKKRHGLPLNYRELANELVEHCRQTGFTHVELMGIMEHPCEGSMGYQVTGFFAPNSRLGSVEDFKYLINKLHEHKIGVILDWIPAHFANDDYALTQFDGSNQFQSSAWSMLGSRRLIRKWDWGTEMFDYSKKDVREFLISSAAYWLQEMHLDALRVDAVQCMLESENSAAAKLFIRDLNHVVHEQCSGAITIAEDYSGDTTVCQHPHSKGLGFDQKWNIGWMRQTLAYFSVDPKKRKKKYGQLIDAVEGDTFHKMVLALSHDEVKKGKLALMNQTKGMDETERDANLRAMLSFMFCVPGKKLNFMGNEIAVKHSWEKYIGKGEIGYLDEESPKEDEQSPRKEMMHELNLFYRQTPAFWEKDDNGLDIEWIEKNDRDKSLLAYRRMSQTGESFACFHNFAGIETVTYRVPFGREDRAPIVVFNSNDLRFGGSGAGSVNIVVDEESGNLFYEVKVAPLTTLIVHEMNNVSAEVI
jgi:1,4-alpha-glucan branching enzyme